jgi:hypothetical protein
MFKELAAFFIGVTIFSIVIAFMYFVPSGSDILMIVSFLLLSYGLGSLILGLWEVRQSRKSGRVEFL